MKSIVGQVGSKKSMPWVWKSLSELVRALLFVEQIGLKKWIFLRALAVCWIGLMKQMLLVQALLSEPVRVLMLLAMPMIEPVELLWVRTSFVNALRISNCPFPVCCVPMPVRSAVRSGKQFP